jgi:hypothetical protein
MSSFTTPVVVLHLRAYHRAIVQIAMRPSDIIAKRNPTIRE